MPGWDSGLVDREVDTKDGEVGRDGEGAGERVGEWGGSMLRVPSDSVGGGTAGSGGMRYVKPSQRHTMTWDETSGAGMDGSDRGGAVGDAGSK